MRIEAQRLIKRAERDAANGVPYEVYDRETAEAKVAAAEEILKWLRQLTRG